jgi:hypothetical protein
MLIRMSIPGSRCRFVLAAAVGGLLAAGAAVAPAAMAGTAAESAVGGAAQRPPAGLARGTVVSAIPLLHADVASVAGFATGIGWPTGRIRYRVDGYQLVYRTVDRGGKPTTASALLAVPSIPDGATGAARTPGMDRADRELPMLVWEHGTRAYRGSVATVEEDLDRSGVTWIASAGFATIAPDYLGLGAGPGHHPYMEVATEVSASTDAITAARALLTARGRRPLPGLYLSGFSQGGQASMALAKALQAGREPALRPVAVAPVSGPYDVERAEVPSAFDGRIDPLTAEFYIAYWTVSMNRLYHLYDRPSEVFNAPYDAAMGKVFDGEHPEDRIIAALPGSLDELLTPAYRERLLHPVGGLADAMRDNDQTCRWRPAMPVRLFAASGDRDVPIANSLHCQAQLRANGVSVPLTDVGDVAHDGSAMLALPQVLDWFATLRATSAP